MSQKEYHQIRRDADGMAVVLEFPADRPSPPPGQSGCMQPEEIQQIKKEIREIFVSELQEEIKQRYGL